MPSTSHSLEKKYASIRKHLDELGYRGPLPVESLPLVEVLIADLLKTTDSLKRCKLHSERMTEVNFLMYQFAHK